MPQLTCFDKRRDLLVRVKEQPPVVVIAVEGYFAHLEVDKFKRKADKLILEGAQLLVFDLSKASFIDSLAIGTLVHLDAKCRQAGGRIAHVRPQRELIYRGFSRLGLTEILDFHSNVSDACKNLRQRTSAPPQTHAPLMPIEASIVAKEVRDRIELVEKQISLKTVGAKKAARPRQKKTAAGTRAETGSPRARARK